MPNAYGSCLIETGKTRVLCTATVSRGVPAFLYDAGTGWLTAEYSMLPGSTLTRKQREREGFWGRVWGWIRGIYDGLVTVDGRAPAKRIFARRAERGSAVSLIVSFGPCSRRRTRRSFLTASSARRTSHQPLRQPSRRQILPLPDTLRFRMAGWPARPSRCR